VIAAKLRKFWE